MPADTSDEALNQRKIAAWIERELRGTVISIERQERWRPAWFVAVETPSGPLSLYIRGRRGGQFPEFNTIDQEAEIQRILGRHGVPVAKVYGLIEDPEAIVLERLGGGIDLSRAGSDPRREVLRDQYLDAMTKIYNIDVAEFTAIGLSIPQTAEATALGLYGHCEARWRSQKTCRDPMMEFLTRWLRRNVPTHRIRAHFVTADAGQFLYDGDALTGLIDFEVSYVGDPAAEVAGWRHRNTAEPLGDLTEMVRRYEDRIGEHFDERDIEYHTVGFSLTNPLLWSSTVHEPLPGQNYLDPLIWYASCARWATEAAAKVGGIELIEIDAPVEAVGRRQQAPFSQMRYSLDDWPDGDEFADYRRRDTRALAEYLSRLSRFGASVEQADRTEIAAITGHDCDTLAAAEADLEAFICDTGPDADGSLLRYFYRWQRRQEFMLRGLDNTSSRVVLDSVLQPIRPRPRPICDDAMALSSPLWRPHHTVLLQQHQHSIHSLAN